MDLLSELKVLVANYPQLVVGAGVAILMALFAWGVLSSSYRYR